MGLKVKEMLLKSLSALKKAASAFGLWALAKGGGGVIGKMICGRGHCGDDKWVTNRYLEFMGKFASRGTRGGIPWVCHKQTNYAKGRLDLSNVR